MRFSRACLLLFRGISSNASYFNRSERIRKSLKMSKVDTQLFLDAVGSPEVVKLKEIFDKHSFELRIAGGAVRDILCGKEPADIDFATTATPNEMVDMFQKESIRMLKFGPRALEHGTCPIRVNDKENYEITTLRIDNSTDGRHADVIFTSDWGLDASRRDLTINAMFLDLEGTLYDYFEGFDDIRSKRIRFVGDAEKRIQEDYLRILRFFRFHSKIDADPLQHSEEVLDIIRKNAHGLEGIAGERIWLELKKIIESPQADRLLEIMDKTGLTHVNRTGLPECVCLKEFSRVHHRSGNLKPKCMTLVAALLHNLEEVVALHARVKMSNPELVLLSSVIRLRDNSIFKIPAASEMDTNVTNLASDSSPSAAECEQEVKGSGSEKALTDDSCGDQGLRGVTGDQMNMMAACEHDTVKLHSSGKSALETLKMSAVKEAYCQPNTGQGHRQGRKPKRGDRQGLSVDSLPQLSGIAAVCQSYVEVLKYLGCDERVVREFTEWEPPKFPLAGKDIQEMGLGAGKVIGLVLERLRLEWVDSGCKLTKEELCSLAKGQVAQALEGQGQSDQHERKSKKRKSPDFEGEKL